MLALEAKSEAENKPKRIYLSALLLFWPHEGQRLLQDLVTVDHGGEITAGVLPFKSFEGGAVKGVMSMVESSLLSHLIAIWSQSKSSIASCPTARRPICLTG